MKKLLPFFIALFVSSGISANYAPDWWQERGVTPAGIDESDPDTVEGNYDVVTIGQLMNMAAAAADELNEKGGGAGSDIEALVSTFPEYNPAEPDANNVAATMGQLFTLAEPFYDRLHELPSEMVVWPEGMTFVGGNGKYPWADFPTDPTDDDYNKYLEAANIGQVKYLFSWSILSELAGDLMSDGFPSGWYDSAYNGTFSEEFEKIAPLRLVPISARSQVIADNEATKTVKVRVVDLRNQKVSGVPVSFAVSGDGGSISPAMQLTDSNGYAQATFSKGTGARYTATASIGTQFRQNASFVFVSLENMPSYSDSSAAYNAPELDACSAHASPTVESIDEIMPPLVGTVGATWKVDYGSVNGFSGEDSYSGETFLLHVGSFVDSNPVCMGSGEGEMQEWTCASYTVSGKYKEPPEKYKDLIGLKYWSRFGNGPVSFYEDDGIAISGHGPTEHKGSDVIPNSTRAGTTHNIWVSGITEDELAFNTIYFDEKKERSILVEAAGSNAAKITVSGPFLLRCKSLSSSVKYAYKKTDSIYRYQGDPVVIIPTTENPGKGTLKIEHTHTIGSTKLEYIKEFTLYNGRTVKPTYELSGTAHRKISMLGMPLNDKKPQSEDETDFVPPETYVDALTLNLRHDVIDYYQAIPNSDLALCVRRNYSPQTWNIKSGLRPYERKDLAFGLGWDTNLVAYAMMESIAYSNDNEDPDTVTVVDENGMSYKFAVALENGQYVYYPMPSDKSDIKAFLNTLTPIKDSGGRITGFTLKKKYGTKLTYERVPPSGSSAGPYTELVNTDRLIPGGIANHKYYRLKKITDRRGNSINYSYSSGSLLIPSKIYFKDLNDSGETAINIYRNADGTVKTIVCPEGYTLTYNYGAKTLSDAEGFTPTADETRLSQNNRYLKLSSPFPYLTSYSISGTQQAAYQYKFTSHLDNWEKIKPVVNEGVRTPYHHFFFDLSEIRSMQNVYSFTYSQPSDASFKVDDEGIPISPIPDDGGVYTQMGNCFYVPTGIPSRISSVKVYDAGNLIGRAEFNRNCSIFPPTPAEDLDEYVQYEEYEDYPYPDRPDEPVITIRPVYPAEDPTAEYYKSLSEYNTRKLTVTNAHGSKIRYTWNDSGDDDLVFHEIGDYVDIYGEKKHPSYTTPIMVYYPKMKIEYLAEIDGIYEPVFQEEVEYNIRAGMAVSKTVGNSGETKTYTYGTPYSVPGCMKEFMYNAYGGDPLYPDPTSETEAGNATTYFSYDRGSQSNTGQMESVSRGSRKTEWTLDNYGNRTKEVITENGKTVRTIENVFSNGKFMTSSIVRNGAGSGKDISTSYTPDAYGRIASKTTAAGTSQYEYNKNGRKILEKDPNGNVTRYVYNARNLLAEIIYPDGAIKSYGYDDIGRKTHEWLKSGNETLQHTMYFYNALHKPILVRRQIDEGVYADTSTEYNALGLPSRITDPNGNVTRLEYDAVGRLVEMIKEDNSDPGDVVEYSTLFEYNENCGSNLFNTDGFKPTGVTNTLGYTSAYTYDKLYRTTQTSEQYAKNPAAYKTTSYTYDIFGNKTSEIDSNGNTTTYTYNALDLPLKTTFADGNYTQKTYTAGGFLETETDEMGNIISYAYDNAGRLIKKTHPAAFNFDSGSSENPTEKFSYDAKGNLTRTIDPRGYATDYVYDSRDRQIFEIKPAVEYDGGYARPTVATAYDAAGNKTSVTDPMGNTTLFEYDMLGRVTKTTFPEVSVYNADPYGYEDETQAKTLSELTAYDANGNITSFTDKKGRVTTTTYNYLNKPTSVTVGSNTGTEYFEYDSEGNLLKITDRGGIVTNYAYDGLNRRTQVQYYATAAETNQRFRNYTYDGLNLTQDSGLSYAYDTRNRLLETNDILTDSGHKFTYAYDPCSRIIGVAGVPESAGVLYSYDALGRLESETNNGKTHEYAYDLSGNRRYAQYKVENDGGFSHALTAEYDTNNRIVKITDDKGKAVAYSYDLNDNPIGQSYAGIVAISRTYDVFNRLTSIEAKRTASSGKQDIVSAEYRYDEAGNVTYLTQVCDGKTQMIQNTYDDLDRLRHEIYTNGRHIEYSYSGNAMSGLYWDYYNDADGNSYSSGSKSYAYHAGSLLIASGTFGDEEDDGTFQIQYNAMGEISSVSQYGYTWGNTVTTNLNYDGYGRLVSSQKTDSYDYSEMNFTYRYDYRGRRLSYAKPSGTTNYYYSDGLSIAETTGIDTTLFYRGPDMGGGVGGINYACNADSKSFNYKYYNLRGDVIATTNAQGSVLSQSQYTAYGEHKDYGTQPRDKHRANTKVEDTDTGLLNEGHRYRLLGYPFFISPDPLEYVDGHNFYAYCGYNPWGRFDPLGLEAYAEAAPGNGNVVDYLGNTVPLGVYAAINVGRTPNEGELPVKDAYLVAVITNKFTNDGNEVYRGTIIVGTDVNVEADGAVKDTKLRIANQNIYNPVSDINQQLSKFGETSEHEAEVDYYFIEGKIGKDFNDPKVNIVDTNSRTGAALESQSGTITQKDPSYYAKDGMKVYNKKDIKALLKSSRVLDSGHVKMNNKMDHADGTVSITSEGLKGPAYKKSTESQSANVREYDNK